MSFLRESDAIFVRNLFKKFYHERSGELFIPNRLSEREFGYFPFGDKMMVRHLSFSSSKELRDLVSQKTPLHIYHSAALYKYPRAPMEEKGWIGAELIFDIDADHLKTPCKKGHDFKICKKCLTEYPVEFDYCTECGGQLEKVEWVCEKCLESARNEARKLLDILEGDFGFGEIHLAFSGNRGYHVVVKDREILDLDQSQRKEIVDYIVGTGLDARVLGLDGRKMDLSYAPELGDPGWRGRIARSALEILMTLDAEALHELTGDKRAYQVVEELKSIDKGWSEKPPWNLLRRSTRMFLIEAAKEYAASHIDVVVTQDVHRLIRLGNSLNGKTGLMAKVFDPDDLDNFDPTRNPVALPMDEEIHVRVIRSNELRLAGFELPSKRKEILELPLAVAALLLCRGVATLP
ncbi:MAG: DNA primase small subunit PriS [Nitrososphaeria archaeon]|nr:DNA primase small subunit PriS [Nitrososphaeria archaeon]